MLNIPLFEWIKEEFGLYLETIMSLGEPSAKYLVWGEFYFAAMVVVSVAQALKKFADDERVKKRLVETVGYGDISLKQLGIEVIGEASLEGKSIEEAVEPLIRALGNRFLRKKAEQALKRIGDRRGLLAVRRRQIRDKMIPKPLRPIELERMRIAG